jgi:hypothetical protein
MTAPSAFVTLDGDRTKWTSNPSYRILNSSSDVSDGSDLTAVRQAFQT